LGIFFVSFINVILQASVPVQPLIRQIRFVVILI